MRRFLFGITLTLLAIGLTLLFYSMDWFNMPGGVIGFFFGLAGCIVIARLAVWAIPGLD